MIIPNAKKAATVIVGNIGSQKEHEERPEAPSEESSALHAIASDVLQAVKDGSPSDLVTALKAFIAEHESAEGEEY